MLLDALLVRDDQGGDWPQLLFASPARLHAPRRTQQHWQL
jgi:hypothetical protein